MEGIIAAVVIAVLLFSLLLVLLTRYKKCPSDKIMVIYGQVGRNKDGSSKSSICIHGGAAFVWPLVQAYQFLDLTPMSLQVDLVNALSRQNIRVDRPLHGWHLYRAGRHAERGGTASWPEPCFHPGACQGHHFRPAASRCGHNGY